MKKARGGCKHCVEYGRLLDNAKRTRIEDGKSYRDDIESLKADNTRIKAELSDHKGMIADAETSYGKQRDLASKAEADVKRYKDLAAEWQSSCLVNSREAAVLREKVERWEKTFDDIRMLAKYPNQD